MGKGKENEKTIYNKSAKEYLEIETNWSISLKDSASVHYICVYIKNKYWDRCKRKHTHTHII